MNPKAMLKLTALVLAAGACATKTPIPATLDPGTGTKLAMVLPASGVQIYECRRKSSELFEWAFVAPEAQLFDARGKQLGIHGAGPHWTAADGSRVTAKVMAKTDSPDTSSIPWLLLEAKDSGVPGLFNHVTHIQRVNTTGGIAPSKPCNGAMVGQQMGVHYTADYRFFVATAN